MTQKEAKLLKHGLYRLYWKTGGASLACVGSLHSGKRWYAPANWTSISESGIACTDWKRVIAVDFIFVNKE